MKHLALVKPDGSFAVVLLIKGTLQEAMKKWGPEMDEWRNTEVVPWNPDMAPFGADHKRKQWRLRNGKVEVE